MEAAHRKALHEQQERHAKQIRELEEQRDRMLQEEKESAARATEALRRTHKEELEREVEQVKRLAGGAPRVETSHKDHARPQAEILYSETVALSEHYSQKCLQLSHAEQSSSGRETVLSHKERELEALRRENQDLKAKLAEEISRMRCFITGQRLNVFSPGSPELSASETETLLRAKENEVQHLEKEISRLQKEVQSLTKEKEAARRAL
ncbi:myosin phosphatase Rho-interacting protein-like [Brachionichthys hirsutus]|uniref:myosin phosphatase Rho-interacting protein-like n=1 Tax=Brachionichthys hirsutus TaxID=412623 RepID=UPI003604FF91